MILAHIRESSSTNFRVIRNPIWPPGRHLGFSFPLYISRTIWAFYLKFSRVLAHKPELKNKFQGAQTNCTNRVRTPQANQNSRLFPGYFKATISFFQAHITQAATGKISYTIFFLGQTMHEITTWTMGVHICAVPPFLLKIPVVSGVEICGSPWSTQISRLFPGSWTKMMEFKAFQGLEIDVFNFKVFPGFQGPYEPCLQS